MQVKNQHLLLDDLRYVVHLTVIGAECEPRSVTVIVNCDWCRKSCEPRSVTVILCS